MSPPCYNTSVFLTIISTVSINMNIRKVPYTTTDQEQAMVNSEYRLDMLARMPPLQQYRFSCAFKVMSSLNEIPQRF